MVVTSPVLLDDYLDHPTEPESELFEGELFQKAMGTTKHSCLQATLVSGTPDGKVATIPLTLCIEILSSSDRFSYTVRKCDEFLRFGVLACWIFDPEAERAWATTTGGLSESPRDSVLRLDGIALSLDDLFSFE